MNDAIILFAHGSRDPEWAAPMRALQDMVRREQKTHVGLAFLELMQPDLQTAMTEAVAQGAVSVKVVPVFLAAGGHLKKDLPLLVAAAKKAHPQLRVQVLPPIGESESLLQAIAHWIGSAAKD